MSSLLITNIKCLVNTREQNQLLRGKELQHLPCINNAYLIIEDEQIAEYGSMEEAKIILRQAQGQKSKTVYVNGTSNLKN